MTHSACLLASLEQQQNHFLGHSVLLLLLLLYTISNNLKTQFLLLLAGLHSLQKP
jgi:hypothetical protein